MTAIKNKDSEKGSIKHQLGVPYLFKTLADESLKSKIIPIPMNIGEVLCFSLAVVHGQEVNRSPHALGIDTGCVYGNKLSAVIFNNLNIDDYIIRSFDA